MTVRTSRLRIEACTKDMLKQLMNDRPALERSIGAAIPPSWPQHDLVEALPFFLDYLSKEPDAYPWLVWAVIEQETKCVVGGVGFKGAPDANGKVEIGYDTAPEFRSRGFSCEAALAMIRWAFGNEVVRVIAETHPSNLHSIQILEKVGMKRIAETDQMISWEINKPL